MREIRYDQVGLARCAMGLVEAEDVLYDGWSRRKARGSGFVLHGRSLEGRLLELELRQEGTLLVVSAGRPLDEAERARYRRRRFTERPTPAPPAPRESSAMTKPRKPDDALPPRRLQTQVLGLRMDDPSLQWLEEAAERAGVTPSVLARMWVMERLAAGPLPPEA